MIPSLDLFQRNNKNNELSLLQSMKLFVRSCDTFFGKHRNLHVDGTKLS
jgi:hypothetical protein